MNQGRFACRNGASRVTDTVTVREFPAASLEVMMIVFFPSERGSVSANDPVGPTATRKPLTVREAPGSVLP